MRFIFVFCFALAFSVTAFGQDLDTDLKKSFNKFSLVKISDRDAHQKAKLRTPFKIQTREKTFQFILRQNDVRAADYKAEYTDAMGRHSLPKGEVFTYKTTLIGERNSIVALTVDGTNTEGYLATETEGYFIESAKKYSSHAKDDDKVIYQTKDKVKKDDGICGLDEAVAETFKTATSNAGMENSLTALSKRRVLEVATEADKEFVQHSTGGNGNPTAANNQILGVMNQVDAVFESQLNLGIEVTFQHAWAPNSVDPYAGLTNDDDLLNTFRYYWQTNFPFTNYNYRRDTAQLFTMKATLYGGLASPGSVCRFPDLAYSFVRSSSDVYRWMNSAHEIAHLLSARHIDDVNPIPSNCDFSIMDVRFPFRNGQFCQFSIDEMTTHINTYGSCLHLQPNPTARTLFDFDADGEADVSVFRPSNFYWYVQRSTTGFDAYLWGAQNDKLSPADFDGDEKTDYAVFRAGVWHIQRSKDGYIGIQLGTSGDIPVPADYDGDKRADVAVFRPSTGGWYRINSSDNQFVAAIFGNQTDDPQIGDFDGDEKTDYAVFRPSTGEWLIQRTTQGYIAIPWGISTDIPVPADYDGDGKTDAAVYRNGTWHLLRSQAGSTSVAWGAASGDIPSPADYDGDGKADVSVFRPSAGSWYRINSSTNASFGIQFGVNGDVPIPSFNILQ